MVSLATITLGRTASAGEPPPANQPSLAELGSSAKTNRLSLSVTYRRSMNSQENDVIRSAPAPTRPDPLIARAQKIDPRTAVCFNGYYGEDFPLGDEGEIQRQVSRALVWSDGVDSVPDWAMREAWTQFENHWECLRVAACERHPNFKTEVATAREVGAGAQRNHKTLEATRAAQILFGDQWFYAREFDPAWAPFSSGADVSEALAAHFGFTAEEYERLRDADPNVNEDCKPTRGAG
jgi:hypothetical protein